MPENDAVNQFVKRNFGFGLGTGIVVGFSLGIVFTKARLSIAREEAISEIIKGSIATANNPNLKDPRAKEGLNKIVKDLGYITKDSVIEDVDEDEDDDDNGVGQSRNIFADREDIIWDIEAEEAFRAALSPDIPYIIHRDEFDQGREEASWSKLSLTYFEGDDVLADSNDQPLDDQDMWIGLVNLSRFGHGSGDPNIVYIRNTELETDIEVVHSDDRFDEQVRGMPIDPRFKRNRGE